MGITLRTFDGGEKQNFQGGEEIPCFRCGLCCVFLQPQLDEIEVRHIALALGLSRSVFQKRYLNTYQPKPGIYLLKRRREACVFLQRAGERGFCLIQRVKPLACRHWTASLTRPECQEGLKRLGGDFLAASQLYDDPDERSAFYQRMENRQKEAFSHPETSQQGQGAKNQETETSKQ